jgi:radical SAM superfamily enzyme YgiQ (UPF0313 family)
MMKDAGCHAVSFGIESGNQEMLSRVRKGITLEQVRNAVAACKASGIVAHASFLVGMPGETLESLKDSEQLSKELDILYGYHFLAPFPGTTVREHIEDYDLEILSDDWNLYDADHVIVKTSHLGPPELKDFVDRATRKIKSEWDDLEKRFLENNVDDKEYMQIGGYHRMVMIYKILSEDLVEENALQKGPIDDALTSMARIISEKTGHTVDFTRYHFSDLIDKGYIRAVEKDDFVRFYWTHNNTTDFF